MILQDLRDGLDKTLGHLEKKRDTEIGDREDWRTVLKAQTMTGVDPQKESGKEVSHARKHNFEASHKWGGGATCL